jgi:hypothetical protein
MRSALAAYISLGVALTLSSWGALADQADQSQNQTFIGEIRCSSRSVDLDTAVNVGSGWLVSEQVANECGLIDREPVPGRLDGGVLVLEIPLNRLIQRDLGGQRIVDFTAGETPLMLDWGASLARPGVAFLNATARYGESRLSAWGSSDGLMDLGEVYWQDEGVRLGRWFDGGWLIGGQYGAASSYTYSAPLQEVFVGRFQAPVFGDNLRIVNAEGQEIQNIRAGSAGDYDLTQLVANLPSGARILIDGQSYEPAIERRVEPGQGIQAFAGLRRYYDFSERREEQSPYAYVRIPWGVESGAIYTTIATDGGRIEAYFRAGALTLSGYAFSEQRGHGARVSASAFGINASAFFPDDEYRERAGSQGYRMVTAGHKIGPGYVSASYVKYDSGTTLTYARYSVPFSWGSLNLEAQQEGTEGNKKNAVFLTLSVPLGRHHVSGGTNGSARVMMSGDQWQGFAERYVYIDGRNADSIYGQVDLNAARLSARYSFFADSLYASAAGRLAFGDEITATRQSGDAILKIEAAPHATVSIDGVVKGRTDRSGVFVTSVTSGQSHIVRVEDNEDSLVVIHDPEQMVRLHPGQLVKIKFMTEEMK